MKQHRSKIPVDKPLRLLVETGDGRSASALLENNFLQHCLDRGAKVHVLSPGACYEPFVESYQLPGTTFSYLSVDKARNVKHHRLLRFEKRLVNTLSRLGIKKAKQLIWENFGARARAVDAVFLNDLINEVQPDCFVTAHLNQGFGHGLIAICHQRGIPTLGNVFSWDHPFYLSRTRPDKLTCWSANTRDDLVKMGDYLPEQIEITGAPVFDAYFDPKGIWTREELCARMGLDPARPILLFATLGQMQMFWDETGTFRDFLKVLDQEDLSGPPQIILRLHPMSIDHYFDEFRKREDIVFSKYSRYCPCMRWWPSREEMFLAGNLLRHADVCISPGSTMSIEAAIFDTPTIVPISNSHISEEYNSFFQKNWLQKHFRFLVEEEAVALANTSEELINAIRRAFADKSWLAKGREKIRQHMLGPLDGTATARLARAAVELAMKNRNRK